jgi:hypothetical protein
VHWRLLATGYPASFTPTHGEVLAHILGLSFSTSEPLADRMNYLVVTAADAVAASCSSGGIICHHINWQEVAGRKQCM